MPQDPALYDALVAAANRTLPRPAALQMYAAAAQLSAAPKLADAWARTLTDAASRAALDQAESTQET